MESKELELMRMFPLGVVGASKWIEWLKSLIEEFLGDLPSIKAYLEQMGFTIPKWLTPILDWLIAHYKEANQNRDMEAPVLDVAGMTCQSAFEKLGAVDQRCARIGKAMKKHPILARIIERQCLRAYQNANGELPPEAIDWQKIIQWIVDNGPAILQFIMMLVSLFGG